MDNNFKSKIEKVKNELEGQLWGAQSSLTCVEDEIRRIGNELEELEDIYRIYGSAKTTFNDSMEIRRAKLLDLETLAENSKSARTYSVGLSNKLNGNIAYEKIEAFENIEKQIVSEIEARENRLFELKQQENSLENSIYNYNISLYELGEE